MSKKIKRYYAIKYFTSDLKGPYKDYQYLGPRGAVVGPWHINKSKKPIRICCNGFHAALVDGILEHYNDYVRGNSRCFVVELDGKVSLAFSKIAAEKIRLVKEIKLSYDQIDDIALIRTVAEEYKCVTFNDIVNILSNIRLDKYGNIYEVRNLTKLH